MQETRDWYLGGDDPREKEVATHSSILAWRIPMDRGVWQATVHGVAKSQTQLSDHKQQQHIISMLWSLLKFSEIAMKIQQPLILINRIHSWEEGFSNTHWPGNNAQELRGRGLDCEGSLRSCPAHIAGTEALPTVSLCGAGPDLWHAVGNLRAGNVWPRHSWGDKQSVFIGVP